MISALIPASMSCISKSNSPGLGTVAVAESDTISSFLGGALSVDAGILQETSEVSGELPFSELSVVYLSCRNFWTRETGRASDLSEPPFVS